MFFLPAESARWGKLIREAGTRILNIPEVRVRLMAEGAEPLGAGPRRTDTTHQDRTGAVGQGRSPIRRPSGLR